MPRVREATPGFMDATSLEGRRAPAPSPPARGGHAPQQFSPLAGPGPHPLRAFGCADDDGDHGRAGAGCCRAPASRHLPPRPRAMFSSLCIGPGSRWPPSPVVVRAAEAWWRRTLSSRRGVSSRVLAVHGRCTSLHPGNMAGTWEAMVTRPAIRGPAVPVLWAHIK